ncbi:pyridoxamine 5'-phosphate oxidase family protein [Streptomyces microflavus]|uniref:pyridoxamine 5'-phosphate oxidase family protein n=1 Tax=Streptomyces microflavus TaxID=1919 RepID=UPI0029ACD9A3|nr:pyridoxamine 5'-phosphate oxidase family protein [Streptomyces microflavus]MDX2404607.1 pyridoxamine 5'-phosphate oxidase family protein [Streptomyces microflavus]
MTGRYAQLAFTPAVQRHQRSHGSDRAYTRMAQVPAVADAIGPDEAWFISERDSFYLATVGETGRPYIQHRGGPAGFLRVLDAHTLGFADFRGNRQYISRGNLDGNDQVSLFLMDYMTRTRMKIFGRARVVEAADDPELLSRLGDTGHSALVERAVLIDVEAFDWNCRQHIPQLFPAEAVSETVRTLQDKVAVLELERAQLRQENEDLRHARE